ncbi:hypothetical protein NBRGN_020_00340 [Nocardia brasiliensis NBRC 14402]|uniref:PepSY domain-containing protein n=1 Tax=Nocardia brasiliensis TaxID=37326 RepID=UPI000301F493|nr:PepSY domain-containing protein [Nocardia brasiliensis]ASF08280.1 hypothetical protein CEQ30_14000 [Nocardia brasiliensis]GAJ79951.1 hypothetical protein NBRGN_020_00340 [Nocardia brasiliensis NBRC 14402]SUB41266.1 Peptidase propeptide and YPEB domain [Nocardia brasiliensis]
MKAALIIPFAAAVAVATVACDDDGSPAATGTTTVVPAVSSSAPAGTDTARVDLANHKFPISAQNALEAARKKFDGTLTGLELEPEGVNTRDTYVYKVKLTSDTEKYTVQLTADAGTVVTEHRENLDADEQRTERMREAINLDAAVPLNDAMATATKARSGRVEKWKIEGKDNAAQYEFDIQAPGDTDEDYEVQVDAYTGQLKTAG